MSERHADHSTTRPLRARRSPRSRALLSRLDAEAHRRVAEPQTDNPKARLEAVEQRLVVCGGRYSPQLRRWRCPAHQDHGYSLSVRLEPDGFVRLECRGDLWGRCDLSRLLEATGLSAFDLAPRWYRHA